MEQALKIHPLLRQSTTSHLLEQASDIAVHIEDEGVYRDLYKEYERKHDDSLHWESSNSSTRYQRGDILIEIITDLFTLKKNNINGEYLVSLFHVINDDYDQEALMRETVKFFPQAKIIRPNELFDQILNIQSSEYRTLVELIKSKPIPSLDLPVYNDYMPSVHVSNIKFLDELFLKSYYLKIDNTYLSPQEVLHDKYLIPTINRIRNGIFTDLLEKTNQSLKRGHRADGKSFYVLSYSLAGRTMVTIRSKTSDCCITYLSSDSPKELHNMYIQSYDGLLPEIMKLVDSFVELRVNDFKVDSKIGII